MRFFLLLAVVSFAIWACRKLEIDHWRNRCPNCGREFGDNKEKYVRYYGEAESDGCGGSVITSEYHIRICQDCFSGQKIDIGKLFRRNFEEIPEDLLDDLKRVIREINSGEYVEDKDDF
ncbi:hypothetical protein ACFL2R_02565 [Patescibacteria group bacterium]